ncbi:MAG: PDZ domain-containing protein, partial [Gammaproteobacteria bacterium]
AQPSPFANGAGWLGVALEDADDGLIITALHAGPATQAGLRAGDRLLAVDGVVLDAAGLQARVAARGAGQPLALRVARDGVTLPLTVTLGDRGAWSGPARHAAPARAAVQLPAAPPWQHAHAERLQAVMSTADRDATAALATMLEGVASARTGHNRSPWRDAVLADPAALASWPVAVRTMLAPALTTRDTWRRAFCTWLVLACAPAASSAAVSDIAMLGTRLARIVAQVDAAFVDWPGGRLALAADLAVLFEITAAGELVHDQPRVVQAIAAMQASMRVSRAGLLAAFADLTALRETIDTDTDTDTDTVAPLARVPAALARYVSGAVLAYAALDDGFVVIGGSGPNRYDMDGLYAVIDSGGDDHYHWSAGLPLPVQYIDDRAGDDHYSAARGGPGAGLLGVALLRDRGGDDRYASALAGCGAGVFGFGVLVDRAGRDVYACARWSSGAGLYGGGALLDGGAGADVYLSEVLAQGIGGPGGVGLLLDAGGNDYYRVNGAVASAYGTPGVFLGLGQGVGYGLRPHDHGGIGILRDLAGNDRYEAGEFGQGGGYFGGLGLLADEGGDDLYSGHRYAQGFAAHQAAGVLADAAGDDVYWALDRAAQGAAWDQSHALLHDGGGNDHYRAGALAQGAAAQQS